jgi:small-conductance mechanosensitive channel/CRP-like cAMP-binding protein
LFEAGVIPYRPLPATELSWREFFSALFKIVWWLTAAWLLVGIFRAFISFERRSRDAKLIQDLVAGLIYLGAMLGIVSYVFDLPIKGLLATPGVIAIILGLALQSTLGDVFSGIVLNLSHSFRPGDWVAIDGGTEGEVIEMNWRATHLLTVRKELAIVPNSVIAKSKLRNVSSPLGIYGSSVTVPLDATIAPARGIRILERAALNCRTILSSLRPIIAVKTITGSSIDFEITFYVQDPGVVVATQNDLLNSIFRHARSVEMRFAPAPQDFCAMRADAVARLVPSMTHRLLEGLALFEPLAQEERTDLAGKMKRVAYDEGHVLLTPGMVSNTLSIVATGVLAFQRKGDSGMVEYSRLGPGDHFGKIGILTGTPSVSKVIALTPTTVYQLVKDDLVPILRRRPGVVEELCRILPRRQTEGQVDSDAELHRDASEDSLTAWFFEKMHKIFRLDGPARQPATSSDVTRELR